MRAKDLLRGAIGLIVCVLATSCGHSTGAKSKQLPFTAGEMKATAGSTPFANNNGALPAHSDYDGPLFDLSHNWPAVAPPPVTTPPWVQAIHGQMITTKNAAVYVAALKRYITPAMKLLIWRYPEWNAGREGWFNQPWLGSIRESIHGVYTGSEFPPSTFPGTGLKKTITTYVLTFYDSRAAYTLQRVWGDSAMTPEITTDNAQFLDGAVIVKLAFIDATAEDWPVMDGAAQWPLFVPINDSHTPPSVTTCSLMQLDIIVKDVKSSPKTGWVFSTLVYDRNAPGDAWDKMVPLGAMWGNDPSVNSAKNPKAPLSETWINSRAPLYSRQTLGWGGRLSGPNDGAVNSFIADGQKYDNSPDSSCMSCHGPAEWTMKSFLLPSTTNPPTLDPTKQYFYSPAPGSADWMRWFQDRDGSTPQDPGQVALDYDMVFAFKSLPLWSKAIGKPVPMLTLPHSGGVQRALQYNGLPVRQ